MDNKDCEILQYEINGTSLIEYVSVLMLFILSIILLIYMYISV